MDFLIGSRRWPLERRKVQPAGTMLGMASPTNLPSLDIDCSQVRGNLLKNLGRFGEARAEIELAVAMSQTDGNRNF